MNVERSTVRHLTFHVWIRLTANQTQTVPKLFPFHDIDGLHAIHANYLRIERFIGSLEYPKLHVRFGMTVEASCIRTSPEEWHSTSPKIQDWQ